MTGVEILSSHPIYNTYIPAWWAIIGGLRIFATFMVSVALVADENLWGIATLIIGTLFSIVLIALALSSNKASIKYWEHTVMVDDSVSYVEFTSKYELLEQDGKLWIVKEKNQ